MIHIPSSERVPILALRGLTVFPGMTLHFDVGREKSIKAVDRAMSGNQQRIFLITQKDIRTEDPREDDLYTVGTVATIKQVLKLPSDTIRILVEGEYRGKIMALHQTEPYLYGRIELLQDAEYNAQLPKVEALIRQSRQLFAEFIDLSQKPPRDQMLQLVSSEDAGFTADFTGTFTAVSATMGFSGVSICSPISSAATAIPRDVSHSRAAGETSTVSPVRPKGFTSRSSLIFIKRRAWSVSPGGREQSPRSRRTDGRRPSRYRLPLRSGRPT